ncbi:MSMEG_0570 family nitrogen starvation response protein [Roseivivax sediminis]|uniref:MSMEG_0570 family protein n=1 Tax=Roseivivax sediminis TaxID=936889 RepID=A0A1I2C2W5_9RHOB|nr:MSMEG_0570 family nitrogen starvation response protein [Roseivivax sediminis]SFE62667.1 MSMEG_0570 family protein [Roseivivax sediminis]
MPETYWTVRWPDGAEEALYSPSSVVAELFEPGRSYPAPEFRRRARTALERASERVRQSYGFACSAAMEELGRIETRLDRLDDPGAEILCLTLSTGGPRT